MKFFLSILDSKNQLNACFFKANGFLIFKYKHLFDKCETSLEKTRLIEDLWIKEHQATLIKDQHSNKIFTGIEFQNRNTMTMFLIKFG